MASEKFLPGIRKVHFTGIGGISMSGLAQILRTRGFVVSGSDINKSDITKKLETQEGIPVYYGHSPQNIKDPDLVVYNAAIPVDNTEIQEARKKGIQLIDRAALLGLIMKGYQYSVAVSGTHGKTTTTSMISTVFLNAGLDPTVHIGGELKAIGGATKTGSSQYFITEACEYHESFLKFHPFAAVILNIDFDHADYFRDLQHVIEAFTKFSLLLPRTGYLVINAEDKNSQYVMEKADCKVITYGLGSELYDFTARNISFKPEGYAAYELIIKGKKEAEINLNVPGMHNVSNSLAAAALCISLGLDHETVIDGMTKFKGAARRFEEKGFIGGIRVIDDYAHHPAEIRTTLSILRNYSIGKVWCVFQPHTYTRTKHLLKDFASAFDDCFQVLVMDIYAAREKNPGDINSSILAEQINSHRSNSAIYLESFEKACHYLLQHTSSGDIVITMGAGDVYKAGELFLSAKNNSEHKF